MGLRRPQKDGALLPTSQPGCVPSWDLSLLLMTVTLGPKDVDKVSPPSGYSFRNFPCPYCAPWKEVTPGRSTLFLPLYQTKWLQGYYPVGRGELSVRKEANQAAQLSLTKSCEQASDIGV